MTTDIEQTPYVYISGALSGVSETRRVGLRSFYARIAEACEQHGLRGYLPHLRSDPAAFPDMPPAEVDHLDRVGVLRSMLVIAYVGEPSTGVGIEIEIANTAHIPCWLVYEQAKLDTRLISRLALGNPACRNQPRIAFTDEDDALHQLAQHLKAYDSQKKAQAMTQALSRSRL